jgi:hypothetical protein
LRLVDSSGSVFLLSSLLLLHFARRSLHVLYTLVANLSQVIVWHVDLLAGKILSGLAVARLLRKISGEHERRFSTNMELRRNGHLLHDLLVILQETRGDDSVD